MTGLFSLSGKVALVTGGNGGIGLGIAKGLAASGASIVVAARDGRKTRRAVSELQSMGASALGVEVDVSDAASVARMVRAALDDLGRVDVLVNNAGTTVRKAPQDYTLDEWKLVVDVNLTGSYLCAREVYPVMAAAGGGKIINIGSMTSIFGSDWVAPYSASKGGVVQMTKSLAVAWAADNIQVNAILPGWVHTDLTAAISTGNPDRYRFITSRIPQGRWAEPDELAGTAVFLASPASDYVTGSSIPVDGGYSVF